MLASGTTLGPYKFCARPGMRGLGEVCRPHDSRLGRDVAIVLSPHLVVTPRAGSPAAPCLQGICSDHGHGSCAVGAQSGNVSNEPEAGSVGDSRHADQGALGMAKRRASCF